MAVTAAQVAAWGRFSVPTDPTELAVLEALVSGVQSQLGRLYYLDDPLTDDQTTAILLQSARLWARRNTPEGRSSFGGDVAVSVTKADDDVEMLLVPRQGFA